MLTHRHYTCYIYCKKKILNERHQDREARTGSHILEMDYATQTKENYYKIDHNNTSCIECVYSTANMRCCCCVALSLCRVWIIIV